MILICYDDLVMRSEMKMASLTNSMCFMNDSFWPRFASRRAGSRVSYHIGAWQR